MANPFLHRQYDKKKGNPTDPGYAEKRRVSGKQLSKKVKSKARKEKIKGVAHKAGTWFDKQMSKKAHNKPITRRLKKWFG